MDEFKCIVCHQIPPAVVFKCCQGHLFCCGCANSNHYLCTCLEVLTEKENPLLEKLKSIHCAQKKTVCDYANIGCLYNDSIGDVEQHVRECRFRPSKCVGAVLKLWNCDFIGHHRDLADHILHSHDLHHRAFTHYQCASIPYLPDQSYGTMNLIQAHNHDFIFYFYSQQQTKQMLFAIYLLGKRKTAKRFYYELTVQNKSDKFRQLKFTERCFSDEDVSLINDGGEYMNPQLSHVIVLSQDMIRDYVKDDQIHFQYKLNEIPKKATEMVPTMIKKKVVPIEKPKVKKDPKKTNLKKVESGIPKPPTEGAKKADGDSAGKLDPAVVILPSSINKNSPPASSLNKEQSPCLTPSINKNEKTNQFLFPHRGDQILQTNHLEAQTYKDPKSSKYYQQLYPKSSIHKPTLKK